MTGTRDLNLQNHIGICNILFIKLMAPSVVGTNRFEQDHQEKTTLQKELERLAGIWDKCLANANISIRYMLVIEMVSVTNYKTAHPRLAWDTDLNACYMNLRRKLEKRFLCHCLDELIWLKVTK